MNAHDADGAMTQDFPVDLGEKGWTVVAASVPGTSHRRTALPCQDASAWADLPGGGVVLAVADGAGSAEAAEAASALAVEAAVHGVVQQMAAEPPQTEEDWRRLIANAFTEARAALLLEAANSQASPRAYGTTLVLAVLTKQWTAVGLVGDCAVVVHSVDNKNQGALCSLCPPQKGEFANATNFLIQPDALAQLDIAVLPHPVEQAALLSDGLLELALNVAQNRPFPPFFEPLFAFAAGTEDAHAASRQLAEFLDSERVNTRTDDDKTLVLVSRVYAASK